jgi:hypothetical protein
VSAVTGRVPTPGDVVAASIDEEVARLAAELEAATVPVVDPEIIRRLRRTGAAVDKAVADRNAAIVEAVAGGASLRAVAKEVGITHVAVLKIVRKAPTDGGGAA